MYFLITFIRNLLFDNGLLKVRHAQIPVISVGNLTMGGTGKTPMVEYILNYLLEKGRHPSMVSRGYGRKTKGLVIARNHSTAKQIGDEPLQIFRKFDGKVPVAVAEKRHHAFYYCSKKSNCIVLDDAFQHRRVVRDLNILLTDYHRRYTHDHVLPWGRLRESRRGARRADVIIVTKCPADLSVEEAEKIRREIKPQPYQTVYFTTIEYDLDVEPQKVNLITGISNPKPLVEYLENQGFTIDKHYNFFDHHRFTADEKEKICRMRPPILTTEKDYMRLPEITDILVPVPIRVKFLFEGENDFRQQLAEVTK